MQHYGHKIIHWAGPDINSLISTWNLNTSMHYVDLVLNRIQNHWVCTKKDEEILRWIHLNPEQIFIPIKVDETSEKKQTISVNDYDLADQLRKSMPDQKVVMDDPTSKITVHFDDRITNIYQSLCRGNYVISNKYLPGSYFIQGFTNVPELRKMIIHTIRQILRTKPEIDEKDVNYYRDRINPSYFKNKLERIAEKEIKKYARLEEITEKTKGVFS